MSNWNEWLSELLARTDLVSLISRYVQLTKKGSSYWGCCPFHHEKTPSFSVSDTKGLFYCFGCQTGGNAINFLSKIESISRFEAIEKLAELAGMTVPQAESKERESYEILKLKKRRLVELLTEAARKYHQNLKDPRAKAAIDYLRKRHISDDLIVKFGLGYSLGYEDIIVHLKSKGFSLSEMKEAGIAGQRADRYYDVFAERLIIPIIDFKGDVIAFGGRILNNGDFAKYRNSSQTIVFDKSKNIFAINLIKKHKQIKGLKNIILCEGYMDVIALHKAGFTNTCASMGTALTTHQAKLLKSLCDNVYISFDGDLAGQKATLRGLDILQSEGLSVKVIVLPEGLDPDDVINKFGAEYYKKLINEALPLTAFKIENLKKNYDISTPDGKSEFAVEAIKIIKALPNPVEQEEYLKMVHKITGYSMNVLYTQSEITKVESINQPVAFLQTDETQSILDEAKEYILAEFVADKPYVDLSEDLYSLMGEGQYQRLFTIISEARKRDNYSPGQLYSFVDKIDEELVSRLVNYEFKLGDNVKKYQDCVNRLKIAYLENEIIELSKEFKKTNDISILNNINQLMRKKENLKRWE